MESRSMRKLVATAAAGMLLFLACGVSAGEGEGTAAQERGFPEGAARKKVSLKREKELLFYNSEAHHRLPSRYLVGVPQGKARKGPAEHLMVEVASSFNSQYVSKELPDSKGPVWQPSASVELYGFGLDVWANFVLNDEPNQGQFNEVDFIPYYTAHMGALTLHPYFMFMVFPNGDKASLDYTPATVVEGDLYVQYDLWKFDLFGKMRARIKGNSGAVYANVGVGFTQPFQSGVALSASALLNMGDEQYLSAQYGPTDTNIDALAFTLAASWEAGGVKFRPNINAAVHVVPEIRRKIRQDPNLDTYLVWGGLDLSYDF
jgi:hypothetical protein